MIQARLYKIKQNKVKAWYDWCRTLSTNRLDEAIATLKQEGVDQEAFFMFELRGDHYALGLIVSKKTPKPADKFVSINKEHTRKKKACLDIVIKDFNIGYFLEA